MSQSNTKPSKSRKKQEVVVNKTAIAVNNPPPAVNLPQTPTDEATAFIQLLDRAARDKDVDVGKMKELLAMKKEILAEQRLAAFNRDFLNAKSEMPRIKKDGSVEYPVNKNEPDGPKKKAFNFAKYETIDREIRPIEEKYGFSRSFTTTQRIGDGGGIVVTCELLHREGHFKRAEIPVPLDSSGGKNNLQGYGSAFSYGKRYTTTMVWDLITENEDDDATTYLNAYIDEIQFKAIQELIEDNDVDIVKFCKHIKVNSLKEILYKDYPKAMHDLRAGIKKRKEMAGGAQ